MPSPLLIGGSDVVSHLGSRVVCGEVLRIRKGEVLVENEQTGQRHFIPLKEACPLSYGDLLVYCSGLGDGEIPEPQVCWKRRVSVQAGWTDHERMLRYRRSCTFNPLLRTLEHGFDDARACDQLETPIQDWDFEQDELENSIHKARMKSLRRV